jgi:hypothetical protein
MIVHDGTANILVFLQNTAASMTLLLSYRLTPSSGNTITTGSVMETTGTRVNVYSTTLSG